jgi:hypothetical protein
MTEQEKNLARLAAWDKYQTTRTELLACKSRLTSWRDGLSALAQKMLCNLIEVAEMDASAIPTPTEFTVAVREFKMAEAKYTDAVQEARRWKWPIVKEDEPERLCR